jgi:ABC-type antimicrobial peptide transport system permease subunit
VPGDKNALVFGRSVAAMFFDPRKQEYADWSNTEPTVDVISNDVIVTGDWAWGTRDEGTSEYHYETYECEGVGLLAAMDSEDAYRVYMNIDSLKDIINGIRRSEGQNVAPGNTEYNNVQIYVEDINKISDICKTIKEDYGFQTFSLNDILEQMQGMARTIEMVLGGIGAVSLLVAAIGIANTMIMSVYERTREIGVMKVIGASFSDLRRMFLVEAGMIGFGGGLLGVGLSYLLSFLMNTALYPMLSSLIGGGMGGKVSVIPVWLAAGALAFAAMVGIVSGYYPARRAMNLSALEGLKNE